MQNARRPRSVAQRLALAAVLVLGTGVAGCGNDDAEGTADDQTAAKSGVEVALLTTGTADDGSWGQANAEGVRAYGAKVGAAKVEIGDNLDAPDQYLEQGRAYAQAGFDVIILAHAAMAKVTQELAAQYPDVKFGQVAVGLDPLAPNTASQTPAFEQVTFLAGVEAALMTRTGKLGVIGGFDFPALTSQMEGFALGARYANPKVQIQRTYINSFIDAGKAKAAAQAQQSRGVDIIFSATDQATQGIFQAAQGGGALRYVIAQYLDKCRQAPDVVLGSVLFNLRRASGEFVEMAANDAWKSENVTLELADGMKLQPCRGTASHVPADVTSKLAETEKLITSGELTVPGTADLSKPGDADKVDVQRLTGAS